MELEPGFQSQQKRDNCKTFTCFNYNQFCFHKLIKLIHERFLLLFTVKCCLQQIVVYSEVLLTANCCLQWSAAYRKLLFTVKCCLQQIVVSSEVLLTANCCFQ